MSLDDYEWKETHDVLEEFSNLLTYTCILCADRASPPYNLGRCAHIFCLSCVEELKGGNCPVTQCGVYAPAREIRKNKMVEELTKSVFAIQQLLPKESKPEDCNDNVMQSVEDLSSPSTRQTNLHNVGPRTSMDDMGDMPSSSSEDAAGVLGPLAGSGGSEDTWGTNLTNEGILKIVRPAGGAFQVLNQQHGSSTFDKGYRLQSISCEVDKVNPPTLMEEVTIETSETLVSTLPGTFDVVNKDPIHDVKENAGATCADSVTDIFDAVEVPLDCDQGIPSHFGGESSRESTPQLKRDTIVTYTTSPAGSPRKDSDTSETSGYRTADQGAISQVDKRKYLTYTKSNTNVKDADIGGLLDDIRAMFIKSAEYSDFSILCRGMTFPCHEFILRARSTVLDRIFKTETSVRSMSVDDVGTNTVAAFLEFMYTEGITMKVDSIKELLYIADKYNIKGLLEFCLRRFPEVEDHMVVDFLVMAHKHNFINFKKEIMSRINQKKSKYIDDKKFMDKLIKEPNLLLELYKL